VIASKIFENFFDAIFRRRTARSKSRVSRAVHSEKPRNRRAPAVRGAKKPIFLDENALCAPCARGTARSRVMTCVARAARGASGDRATVVTCDDSCALKDDVNGLQEFLKSVG
jgi:hypothetical protein